MPQTDDRSLVEAVGQLRSSLLEQLQRRIVGQEESLELVLVALLARGHALITGVPGLGKTLLVKSLAEALSLRFSRIQFTPDLMPSDVTGTDVIEEDRTTGHREFKFVRGPVFTNLLLADELNRTPPRTQAALLQAMQEYAVTVMGRTWPLEWPFHVFATQNPIEHEGTYPLPEALLDRFLVSIRMEYPSVEEERVIVQLPAQTPPPLDRVLGADTLLAAQALLQRIPVPESVVQFIVELVRSTRPQSQAPAIVREFVSWGAGPRAAQSLLMAAKAKALLLGEPAPLKKHVAMVAVPVLGHRLVLNFRAETQHVSSTHLLNELVKHLG